MAGGVIGGLIGNSAAAGDIGQAKSYANQQVQPFTSLDLGPDAGRAYNFTNEQVLGSLTPEQLQNIALQPSAVSQIQEDPSLRAAQVGALNQLQSAGRTGFTPADQAAIAQLMSQTNANTQGQQQALAQKFAQMGQAGSGTQLAQQLAATQGGANTANANALQLAGLASQNALSALSQSGNLGGQVRSQDFSNAQQKAAAADAVNKFNTQNQLANQAANVQANNAAQQANLQNAQSVGNFNANLANQNQILQRQGEQQQFQRRLAQAQGTSSGAGNAAKEFQTIGSNTAKGYADMGTGLDSAITGSGDKSGGGGIMGSAGMAALL